MCLYSSLRAKSVKVFIPDNKGNVPLETVEIPPKGLVVHLRAYGFVKVFRIVSKDGDTQHWVTDVQDMDEAKT
ncbi:hypothetical protein MSSAC_1879 [Methanosarcina siciliae C2J]|uniref:Uncharacterized protein n=1 Tax=Methanosarcina siciliae C2J TaxID=1434118 RepID=A0A0E3PN63_9EURY|nr:hypothetical protein MSSAC_1879 [Methanosarcina siciliae C2J]